MNKSTSAILQWMVTSRNFQKYGGWLGVSLATMEFVRLHHEWIKLTRKEFGISDVAWHSWTQYIIGLTLMGGSIALTKMHKKQQDERCPPTSQEPRS